MNKKYQIIYADPPWHFSSKELQKYGGVRFTSMDKHYETQSKDWIKELPVGEIADTDCALFLWSTDAHIKEAIETMEAWGFKYVTIAFIWEKKTKTGKTVANLGAWTMKNYEVCLFGTKGTMLKYKKVNNIYQKVEAERTVHSRKPEQVIKNIELLFGDLPKIELFARQKTEGWDVWGNEVESDINLLEGILTKSLKERKLAEFREKFTDGLWSDADSLAVDFTDKVLAFISDMADEYEAKIEQAKRETVEEIIELFKKSFVTTDVYLVERFINKLKSHLTDKKDV